MEFLKRNNEEETLETLTQVVKILNEPVIIVGSNLEILTANIPFKDSFNIKKYAARKGAHLDKVLEEQESIKTFIEKKIQKEEVEEVVIYEGSYYNIKVSTINYNKKRYFVFLFHDVTEQEKLEIKTKKFTSNVAHELKTPLAGISSISEIIAFNEKITPEVMRQEAKYIYEEVQRLTSLVDDLLQISKFDKNPRILNMEQLNLTEIIEYVLNSLKKKIDDKNLEIQLDIYENDIYGDFNALVQIFLNLIDNATKYANSKIRIKSSIVNNKLRVKVEDDGIGMTQKQASKVFVRFYRTDESRDRNSGGTGLGLSIVKELVSLHYAKISVRSKVNMGTDFIIDFPIKESENDE